MKLTSGSGRNYGGIESPLMFREILIYSHPMNNMLKNFYSTDFWYPARSQMLKKEEEALGQKKRAPAVAGERL
jgi:hypothetical protein